MGFRGRVLSAGLSQLGRRGLEALHCVLPSECDWSEGEGERRGWRMWGKGRQRRGGIGKERETWICWLHSLWSC